MIRYIPLSIPFGLKKIWDVWNIRVTILFSLLLQTVLIFVAPIRKSSRKKPVILLIWLAYLLADAAANFAITLILNSQRNQSNAPECKPKSKESSDLLAFWAPFLLLHLGGPDTITAFALEDNQLWLRHFFGLGFQAAGVLYVFVLSLPNENLWIPTTLMLIAGIIKYVERTVALYIACLDNFRDSMLKPPNPGPNYVQLMAVYSSKREAKLPMRIHVSPRPDKEAKPSDVLAEDGILNDLQVVHYAYEYFQKFKGLIVNRMFSFRERDESRDFFFKRTAEQTLRIIEIELNLIYGTFYTKVEVVHSIAGCIFRFLAFGSVLATLGIIHFQAKQDEFQVVDIAITYTLLLGAIVLDVIAFLMLIFSDRTFASIKDRKFPCRKLAADVFSGFLALKKPWWHHCDCTDVKHNLLATPLLLRGWSGSVSAHSLVRYCLKSSSTTIHEFPSLFEIIFEKIVPGKFRTYITKIGGKISHSIISPKVFIGKVGDYMKRKISVWCMFFSFMRKISVWCMSFSFMRKISPYTDVCKAFEKCTWFIEDFRDEMMYVSCEPLTKELWEFIFNEIRTKSSYVDTPEAAKLISSARGEWVLRDASVDSIKDYIRTELQKYVSDVRYDESLLLWHIATDLCYYTEKEVEYLSEEEKEKAKENFSHRQFSKILSDYMLYLLVFQPTMMSAVAGIAKIRIRDTCAEAERFFKTQKVKRNEENSACEEILSVNTDVEPMIMKGEASKSLLFDASVLAKLLKEECDNKWTLMSRVWVELLSYAASNCGPSTHAQQVSKGGELISFIWLLMAHFGLGEQFEMIEVHSRAKMIVGK